MKKVFTVLFVLALFGWSNLANAQTLTIGTILPDLCPGDSVEVPYTAFGSFTGNVFTAQLSDASGSFASPITIGVLTCDTSSTIHGYIGNSTPLGTNYEIRVVASNSFTGNWDTSSYISIGIINDTITANGPLAFCQGHSITLDAGVYGLYLWSTGATTEAITVTTSGTYSCTVSNSSGGCSSASSQIVTVLPVPTPIITSNGPDTFPSGDSVQLDAGVYASYMWNTGATTEAIEVTTTNFYHVIVTASNGCTAGAWQFDSVMSCSAFFTIAPDTIQHHYVITSDGVGASPVHYLWSWGDSTYDTIPYPNHTYANAGIYNICLSINDANSCTNSFCRNGYNVVRTENTMVYIRVIGNTTGINTIALNNSITLFPNPANTAITLHSQLSILNSQLIIIDIMGNKIYQQNISGIDNIIDVSSWSEGIYFYELKGTAGNTHGKFIVQK